MSYIENHTDKIFDSIDGKHQIETNIIGDVIWFNINKMNYESLKTFLILLKDLVVYMKKNNILWVKQYIMDGDKGLFKKSIIEDLDGDKCIISTNINDFIDEIINVFDIKKI